MVQLFLRSCTCFEVLAVTDFRVTFPFNHAETHRLSSPRTPSLRVLFVMIVPLLSLVFLPMFPATVLLDLKAYCILTNIRVAS